MREVIDGILYVNAAGCRWRATPHDLPHWRTCHNSSRSSQADGTWDGLVTTLRVEVRAKLGRNPTPSGGCIDGQSARAASGGAEVGADGAERVRGRKRHAVTDAPGLPPVVLVTAANCDDGGTAPRVPTESHADEFPRLAVVWADTRYRNHNLGGWPAGRSRLPVEVTAKPEGQASFEPLATRWVVEQTFGCLVRSRRVARDYERPAEASAAMVKVSRIHRMAGRARPPRGKRKVRYKRPPAS